MTSDIRAQIESVNAQIGDAFKRGDATAVANLYTSGAQLLPQTATSFGARRPSVRFGKPRSTRASRARVWKRLRWRSHGDTAIEIGRYRLLAAGDVVADQGKYIVVWKNDNGAWKLHRDIWTTSQAAAAAR